jgi:predicted N-acetyltransferase YhbS
MRRRGIGTLLMEAVLAALSGCETVKLDATPAGRELYLRLGFADEYELARLVASRAHWPDAGSQAAPIRAVRAADLAEIVAFDAPVFGADRGHVLRAWYERTPGAAFVARREGRVVGYALGRPGATFATIGPVIAFSEADACSLTRAVGLSFGTGPVGVDAPAQHGTYRAWLEDCGFSVQRPLVRMYRGPNRHPGLPERQWAILGPEVG